MGHFREQKRSELCPDKTTYKQEKTTDDNTDKPKQSRKMDAEKDRK